MNFFQEPLFVAAVLCFSLVLASSLSRFGWGRIIGSPIIVIVLCMVFSNIGVIPSAMEGSPVYDGVFKYVAPLGIFIALLEVDLKSLKNVGMPILAMFGLGAVGTVTGVLVSWFLVNPMREIGELAPAVAGMFAGTYIGGSINFNAIALNYGVNENGSLYAATTVVDNLVGTSWIIISLLLPKFLQRLYPRKKLKSDAGEGKKGERFNMSISSIASVLALGLMGISVSKVVLAYFPGIPEIITLTTIALVLAQFSGVKQLHGKDTLGFFFILIFLGVIGTLCDVSALGNIGSLAFTLFLFVIILVMVHGLVIFGIGSLFRADWDVIAVASQANIGGNTTALAAAESLNRPDLLVPGVLVGSLGNALGTYIGFTIAGIL